MYSSTNCTPASLVFDRELKLPIDLAIGIPEMRRSKCETDYAYELERQLIKTHDLARKHIQINSDGMKNYYDRNANLTVLRGGCRVVPQPG